MPNFEFGASAVVTPDSETKFNSRRDEIIESIKPDNILEKIFTEELIHASWEMERVRDNNAIAPAADRLNVAYGRASRNWQRAVKQLKTLQSARAAHISRLFEPEDRKLGATCPLANPAKFPKPCAPAQEVK